MSLIWCLWFYCVKNLTLGNFLRKFLATIFMMTFIVVFIVVTFIWGIYSTFFNADFYKGSFTDSVYNLLVYDGQRYIEFQPIAEIKKSDFTSMMQMIISKEDLKVMVSDVVSQVQILKVDDQGFLELKIPMKWLSKKTTLFSEVMSNYLYGNLPKCTPDQQDYLREFECVPDTLPRADFDSALKLALDRKLISDFPDEFNLKFQVPEQFQGKDLRVFFNDLSAKIFLVCVMVLTILLILIGLMVFRPFVKVLRWELRTIFLASFLSLLTAMALNILIPIIFDKLLSISSAASINYNAWLSVYILIVGSFTNNLLKLLIPIILGSLVLWITVMIYDKRNSPKNGSTKIDREYQELH